MAAKRPTILQIIPELETGGAELSAIEVTEGIVRAGGRALVLSEGGRLASRISACGGEFVPFPAATKNPVRMLWNAGAIGRIASREGVDLLHARSRAPAWSALLAARQSGRAFVTTYHGAYAETGPIKRAYNSVMARGDVVIANSGFTARLIEARYGVCGARVRVVHRGVDGRVFDPGTIAPERTTRLRRKWGLGPGTRIVMQAARLTGWKGQRVLIEAARLLLERGGLAGTQIILAGDDQGRDGYREELERRVDQSGLRNHVRLVGHVDDMPAAFALAHVAVIASTEPEAFGRTATEAQAMGCPVIATELGAPPETIIWQDQAPGGRTGWMVPPRDEARLAQALQDCLALSDGVRTAMGQRARTHVLEAFSLDAMRRQTLEVYDSLIGTSLADAYQRSA